MRSLLGQIRPDRQTVLFSATWPKAVQGLARDLCKSQPVHINIGDISSGNNGLKANKAIKQDVIVVNSLNEKDALCEKVLTEAAQANKQVIVFAGTKRGCDNLCRYLTGRLRLAAVARGFLTLRRGFLPGRRGPVGVRGA